MRTLVLASLLLLATSACRIKGDPTVDAASASCRSVSFTCDRHADCCSYACVSGVCIPNPLPNGVCRTSDDCATGSGFATVACVGGKCTPGAQCHPVADTCTVDSTCCSGNCLGTPGSCYANTTPTVTNVGPVEMPYYASTTLTALASDADPEDSLYYRWSITNPPAGSGLATTWGSTAVHPTVFLAVPGTYVFNVLVTDRLPGQRDPKSASGTVTVNAVNLPPIVSAGADVPSLLRNHPLAISGTVFDPNLGATIVRCAWYAKPPSPPDAPEVLLRSYASCPSYAPNVGYQADATFVTTVGDPQGDWTVRLEAFDGQYLTSDTRTITVVDAPPVPVACPGCAAFPDARVVNLRDAGDPAPARLNFSGTATDANSDVGTPGFTWSWTVTEKNGAPFGPVALASGAGTTPPFTATFEPTAAGTYLAVLHVDDGRGMAADATVVALVEPYVRPLMPLDGGTLDDGRRLPSGSIADASYFHGATAAADRLVFVGSETASTHRLWILDPETPGSIMPAGTLASLGAAPDAFAVRPDGSEATVVTSGRTFVSVTLSATPAVSQTGTLAGSWSGTATDVLYAARTYAVSDAGSVHELGPSANQNVSEPARCGTTCYVTGTRGTFAGGDVWIATPTGGGAAELRRFVGKSNGLLEPPLGVNPASGITTTTNLWISADDGGGREILAANRNVYDATSVTLTGTLLPASARHADSVAPGGVRSGVMVDSVGQAVTLLDASWNAAGTLRVPHVGYRDTGYPPEAFYAFVRSDGSARYVVFRATVLGAPRWYLVRY